MTRLGDKVGSVAPGDLVICDGYEITVQRVVIHPPGHHDASPIVDDMFAVEAVTHAGSRWAGGVTAEIGSDLRAHWSRP
jgi:hypothetical protein